MRRLVAAVLALVIHGAGGGWAQAQFPFTVDVSEDVSAEFPGAPRVHSFSFAQWKGRWVFIGGRLGGYHAVGGGAAEFLRADSNRDVWVVDTTVSPARTYHLPVARLPGRLAPVKEQWTATGQLYFQDGDTLYIGGGYGQDDRGKWVTFDVISRVDLPALIDGVMHGRFVERGIQFARTPLVQSAGGGLTRLSDGYFYLVMGHTFQGSYTAFEGHGERNTAEASQAYLGEIRKLRIDTKPDGTLRIASVEMFQDAIEFHRRDLNVAQVLSPRGLGLAAYGGVFTPDTQLSYSKPVYLFEGSRPEIDRSFDQRMNAYACPVLLMYSEPTHTMYSTFFGGISRHAWVPSERAFVENPKRGTRLDAGYLDGLQWSDQISTVAKVMTDDEGETTEVVHAGLLPSFIGAGAVFIPAPALPRARSGTDILAFESVGATKTFVGYLYGGIRAYPYRFPYLKTSTPYDSGAVSSKPNDMILKVYVERQPRR
jgi:hypothetical protein